MRSSIKKDPGLHTGLAYFTDDEPYRKHVLKYATQKDVSFFLTILLYSLSKSFLDQLLQRIQNASPC